jgi:TolB-like protein
VVLLETLLDAGGEPVSKAALIERAWPDAIVEEGNLAVQIGTLRKTLQSLTPDGRDWITTVPRLGYRLVEPFAALAATSGVRPPLLAVMPFGTLDAVEETDYFGHGIVEELTTALSRFRNFAVLSRSAATAYRAQEDNSGNVAGDLGVNYVLEGSIERSADRVRVFTHLSNAATGVELWAQRFDGSLAEIFDFEDRITEAVVGVVEPHIRRAEIERVRRKRPGSLGAYDLYLQALPDLYAASPRRWEHAIAILKQVIALDPGFAPALAAIAWAHEKRIRQYLPPLGPDDTTEALAMARAAVSADSSDATVLAVGGWVPIAINSEFETGLAMVRRALALNPNNLLVLNLAGASNVFAGDLDEARACYMRAFELSPGAPDAYLSLAGLAQVHLLASEFTQAIHWGERAYAINDEFPMIVGNLACAYALAGYLDQARATMAHLLEIKPHMTLARMAARRIRDRPRWRNVIEGLRLAGMPVD